LLESIICLIYLKPGLALKLSKFQPEQIRPPLKSAALLMSAVNVSRLILLAFALKLEYAFGYRAEQKI